MELRAKKVLERSLHIIVITELLSKVIEFNIVLLRNSFGFLFCERTTTKFGVFI